MIYGNHNISSDIKKQNSVFQASLKKFHTLKLYNGISHEILNESIKRKKLEGDEECEALYHSIPGLSESGWDLESYKKCMYFL